MHSGCPLSSSQNHFQRCCLSFVEIPWIAPYCWPCGFIFDADVFQKLSEHRYYKFPPFSSIFSSFKEQNLTCFLGHAISFSHTEDLVVLLCPCRLLFDLVSNSSLPTFPVGKTIAPSLMRSGYDHPFLHDLCLLKIFEPKGFCLGKSPIFCRTCAHSPLLPLNTDSCWHLRGLLLTPASDWDFTSLAISALMPWGCLPHMGELLDGSSGRSRKTLWDVLGLRLVLMTWKLKYQHFLEYHEA